MPKEYAENLFLQEKPTLALLAIWDFKRTYASVITKEINSTFAHTTKILSKMEEHSLIKFTVEGRIKYVELTEQGHKVVEALKELIIALEGKLPKGYDHPAFSTISDEELIKDMDPASAAIYEKIIGLRTKIESIYKDLIKSSADMETIKRKLGPFSRDIKKIGNLINESEDSIRDEVIIAYHDTEDVFVSLLRKG
ncbi:MAG: MarR family transcriptional regulator [Euryarchaeota archaeon]|nr:MarR family transcriptional regulator [Euryarchaeota archaeon]